MAYNLLTENWIPWQRRSGTIEYGPPSLLTDQIADNPIVAIAAPRPDFAGALQEFLIGLLGVALQVENETAWKALWDAPPTPAELRAALDKLPPAFDLDGDGARYSQDYTATDLAGQKPVQIDQLLIDAAGKQTGKLNKDLFVKRGRVERLGRPAAAMALITLQTYSPAGGSGIRTSLRGGGPLTTLVDPRVDVKSEPLAHQRPLWQKLWANVETVQQAASRSPNTKFNSPADIFPWLAPTRASVNSGAVVTPANSNPWQAYFGLPRRIRLDFDGPGRCDLTGNDDQVTVTTFRSRKHGVQYLSWQHPLTPYRKDAKKPLLPVHGQPGGVGWRDWLGLTFGSTDGKRRPAATVAEFNSRGRLIGVREGRIHAFGYDMDNAKARGWTDASQPVFVSPGNDAAHQDLIAQSAARLTEGASISASLLLDAVKCALYQRPKDAKGDLPTLSTAKAELWAATEEEFFSIMRVIAAPGATAAMADERCQLFLHTVARHALGIFDRWSSGSEATPAGMRRVVFARRNLARAFVGKPPWGKKLFGALRIPLPDGGRTARTAMSRTPKEV